MGHLFFLRSYVVNFVRKPRPEASPRPSGMASRNGPTLQPNTPRTWRASCPQDYPHGIKPRAETLDRSDPLFQVERGGLRHLLRARGALAAYHSRCIGCRRCQTEYQRWYPRSYSTCTESRMPLVDAALATWLHFHVNVDTKCPLKSTNVGTKHRKY